MDNLKLKSVRIVGGDNDGKYLLVAADKDRIRIIVACWEPELREENDDFALPGYRQEVVFINDSLAGPWVSGEYL